MSTPQSHRERLHTVAEIFTAGAEDCLEYVACEPMTAAQAKFGAERVSAAMAELAAASGALVPGTVPAGCGHDADTPAR